MDQPPPLPLGWWLQLVDSSQFDEPLVRDAAVNNWASNPHGTFVRIVDWPKDNPSPLRVNIYGTREDIPPDLDDMAEAVRPYMLDGQYFMFAFMQDAALSPDGIKFIVFTKRVLLKVSGSVSIESVVNEALVHDKMAIRLAESWGTHAQEEQ